jgi:TolB protein
MIRRTLLLVLISALPAGAAFPQTDVYLQTEASGRGEIPIVVSEFEAVTPDGSDIAFSIVSVLRKDLFYTGIFEPLSFVPGGGDTLAEGRTAAAIVEGSLFRDGGRFRLETRLLDFASREIIFSKIYTFAETARRDVAHHICDEILFFLVGEQGIATTRILFCRRDGDVKHLYLIDYDGFGERRLTKDELIVSPLWLDEKRFCYTSYRRDNPDCYLVDLESGKRTLISYRKGLNLAGGYFAERDEIAMTLSVNANSEIYLIDSRGEILRRLTRNRAIDCSPTWAPNGKELAFVSDRSGNPHIYIMDRFGGNTRRLTTTGSYNTSPAWSPYGDVIAFASRDGWLYRLKLITPDGLTEEVVFDDYLSYEDPSWAPNGRHIAVTVRYGGKPWIVIVDIDTKKKRRLVQGETPAWSPLSAQPQGR